RRCLISKRSILAFTLSTAITLPTILVVATRSISPINQH
ncbi:alpha amylase, catalytic domain protein, partial [Vibrio parahaemolyticus V-223/04]